MSYFSLVLAIIRLLSSIMTHLERAQWMNEGERRLRAQQLKETTHALAMAAGISHEYAQLSDTDFVDRVEAEGWYRD